MEVNFQEKSLEKTQNAINNLMKSMKLVWLQEHMSIFFKLFH
jgi:hypothetical protein